MLAQGIYKDFVVFQAMKATDTWSQASLPLACALLKRLPWWLTTGISVHLFQVLTLKQCLASPLLLFPCPTKPMGLACLLPTLVEEHWETFFLALSPHCLQKNCLSTENKDFFLLSCSRICRTDGLSWDLSARCKSVFLLNLCPRYYSLEVLVYIKIHPQAYIN